MALPPHRLPQITVLAVGRIKDRELALKAQEYAARLSHDVRLQIESVKDSPARAADGLLARVKKHAGFVFVLSERGRHYTSERFSSRLCELGPQVCFLIGGPCGLGPAVEQAADELLALSSMTFPHELAQVMLLEQLYRAVSIYHKRKYHK